MIDTPEELWVDVFKMGKELKENKMERDERYEDLKGMIARINSNQSEMMTLISMMQVDMQKKEQIMVHDAEEHEWAGEEDTQSRVRISISRGRYRRKTLKK